MKFKTYKRADGIVGIGFEIDHCGRKMHSVAYPDKPGERFNDYEAGRKGFKIADAAQGDGSDELAAALDELAAVNLRADHLDQNIKEMTGYRDAAVNDLNDAQQANSDLKAELDALKAAPVEAVETDAPDYAEKGISEAEAIRRYLAAALFTDDVPTNDDVIKGLAEHGIDVTSSQVTRQRPKAE